MKTDKFAIYKELQNIVSEFLELEVINTSELGLFDRLLKNDIYNLPEDQIFSSGYVIHTLEASIWCLLTTDSYKEAV